MQRSLIHIISIWMLLASVAQAQQAPAAAQPAADTAVFATVDGEVISQNEFWQAFRQGIRQKFYHGQVPAAELDAFARKVGQELIDHRLLVAEARRTGVEPDRDWIQTRLEAFKASNQDKPVFQTHAEEILQRVREQLEVSSLLSRIEEQFRAQVRVDEADVREFFEANPDVFTEPERVRVGLILLRVDPGAANADWQAAQQRANVLLEQINAGTAFEDVAREHSDDPSAEQGGDMGYLHEGMLGGYAQSTVDKLEIGQVSEPVPLLEGAALLKLIDRKQAQKVSFERARERAAGLALEAKKDSEWQQFVEALRQRHTIEINESVYAQVVAGASGNAAQQPTNDAN